MGALGARVAGSTSWVSACASWGVAAGADAAAHPSVHWSTNGAHTVAHRALLRCIRLLIEPPLVLYGSCRARMRARSSALPAYVQIRVPERNEPRCACAARTRNAARSGSERLRRHVAGAPCAKPPHAPREGCADETAAHGRNSCVRRNGRVRRNGCTWRNSACTASARGTALRGMAAEGSTRNSVWAARRAAFRVRPELSRPDLAVCVIHPALSAFSASELLCVC